MAATSDDILTELRALRAEQAEFRRLIAPVLTRKGGRAAQAKAAGVHPSTLWRRERAARAKLALQGGAL